MKFLLLFIVTWCHVTLHKKVFDLDHKFDELWRIYDSKLLYGSFIFLFVFMIMGYVCFRIDLGILIIYYPFIGCIDRLYLLHQLKD